MKRATLIAPSTTTKPLVPCTGSQFVISAGETLKSNTAKPIAIAKAKISCPRESSVMTSFSSSPSLVSS